MADIDALTDEQLRHIADSKDTGTCRARIKSALSSASTMDPSIEIWGKVDRRSDGKLAIFSLKYNAVKAQLTSGNSVGLNVGDKVLISHAANAITAPTEEKANG